MPKFLYTILGFTVLLWTGVYFLGKNLAPDTITNIFVFLCYLWVVLSVTFSIPVYFYFFRQAPKYTELRNIYRRSLKWGCYASFGVVGYLCLRAFKLVTVFNVVLFLALYIAVFVHIRTKK